MLKCSFDIFQTVLKVADARKTIFSIQQAALCFAISRDLKRFWWKMNGSVSYVTKTCEMVEKMCMKKNYISLKKDINWVSLVGGSHISPECASFSGDS